MFGCVQVQSPAWCEFGFSWCPSNSGVTATHRAEGGNKVRLRLSAAQWTEGNTVSGTIAPRALCFPGGAASGFVCTAGLGSGVRTCQPLS